MLLGNIWLSPLRIAASPCKFARIAGRRCTQRHVDSHLAAIPSLPGTLASTLAVVHHTANPQLGSPRNHAYYESSPGGLASRKAEFRPRDGSKRV